MPTFVFAERLKDPRELFLHRYTNLPEALLQANACEREGREITGIFEFPLAGIDVVERRVRTEVTDADIIAAERLLYSLSTSE